MKRFPWILAAIVVLIKLIVIVLVSFSPNGVPSLVWLVLADRGPMWAADTTTQLFFDQRRVWPTSGESIAFDVALLLFTAIQWYVCGLVVRWLAARRWR